MNLFSVSYRKICSFMHQLRNRKVKGKHLLIAVTLSFFWYEKIDFLKNERIVHLYRVFHDFRA